MLALGALGHVIGVGIVLGLKGTGEWGLAGTAPAACSGVRLAGGAVFGFGAPGLGMVGWLAGWLAGWPARQSACAARMLGGPIAWHRLPCLPSCLTPPLCLPGLVASRCCRQPVSGPPPSHPKTHRQALYDIIILRRNQPPL